MNSILELFPPFTKKLHPAFYSSARKLTTATTASSLPFFSILCENLRIFLGRKASLVFRYQFSSNISEFFNVVISLPKNAENICSWFGILEM